MFMQLNWEGAWFQRIRKGECWALSHGGKPCVSTTLFVLVVSWDSDWLKKRPFPSLLTLSPWCIYWHVHYPDREPVHFLHMRELKESTFHCWGFTFSLKIASQWFFFLIHIEDTSPLPHKFKGWWIVSLLWSRRECVFFHHWQIS